MLANILRSNPNPAKPAPVGGSSHQALAKAAVGRGIRHGVVASGNVRREPTTESSSRLPDHNRSASNVAGGLSFSSSSNTDCLNQLTQNYQNSLAGSDRDLLADTDPTPLSELQGGYGNFGRSDSLVDLAMIPCPEDEIPPSTDSSRTFGLSFIDFPSPELQPDNAHQGRQS